MSSKNSFRRFLVSLVLLLIAGLASGAEEYFSHAPRSVNSSYLDFGPAVDKYIVGNLPNVNFDLPGSWAGQIPVANTSNDELFFWLFAAENQAPSANLISRSLTASKFLLRADIYTSMVEWRSRVLITRWIDERERYVQSSSS